VSSGAARGRASGGALPGKHAGSLSLGGHQALSGGAAASSHSHSAPGPSITAHGRRSSATHSSRGTHRGRLQHQPVRHPARSKRGASRSGAGGGRALAHRQNGSHVGAVVPSGAAGNTGHEPAAQVRKQSESEAAVSLTTATPVPQTPPRGSGAG